MSFVLDVNSTDLPLNGTNLDDGPKLVWGVDNLGDGDHQLFMEVASPQQYGSVAVDYFEYVVPSLYIVIRTVSQQHFCFQG